MLKTLPSFMLNSQKNKIEEKYYFGSFHSSIFLSKIHNHPACKMNRDEQGGAG